MIKIGLEGSLFFKQGSGVGRYANELIKAASKIDSDESFEIVRHYLPGKKFVPPIKPTKNLGYRLVRWFPPAVYFQVFKRLGWFAPYDLLALKKYDFFIFFNFVAFPLRRKTKGIVVIHDLAYIYYPEYVLEKNRRYLERFVPLSINRSSHVITVSEYSKKDIMEHYHVPDDKISVIYNAIDHEHFYPRPQKEIAGVRKKYNLPEKYILFTGNIEPRKNLTGVLDAYSRLDDAIKEKCGLVLVGGKGWNDDEILEKIKALKEGGAQVITPGFVPDEDLPLIYSGASLFVFPSFYEGFGIPPLEALACGVPVITSNASSLPEVVDEAAIAIDPNNTGELAAQMAKVLTDASLAKKLSAAGLKQAQKFSWDKSARELIALLERLNGRA